MSFSYTSGASTPDREPDILKPKNMAAPFILGFRGVLFKYMFFLPVLHQIFYDTKLNGGLCVLITLRLMVCAVNHIHNVVSISTSSTCTVLHALLARCGNGRHTSIKFHSASEHSDSRNLLEGERER